MLQELVAAPYVLTSQQTCITPPSLNTILTPAESISASIIYAVPGSVGYTTASASVTTGLINLYLPQIINDQVVMESTSLTPLGPLSCAYDTFNPIDLSINTVQSTNMSCWPLTATAYLGIRKSYSASSTDSGSCTKGIQSLQLVQWLATNPALKSTTDYQLNPRPSEIDFVATTITNTLNAITCDGKTLLIMLPSIWEMSPAVAGFGNALAVLGLLGIVTALTIVGMYRSNSVMKSASTWFVFTSLFGVGMMFVSIFFLVSDVTTANCSAFNWFVNVGFMLAFAPLLAKTWRIYRIFGRKKLSVVKVTNQKLGVIVAIIISLELLLSID